MLGDNRQGNVSTSLEQSNEPLAIIGIGCHFPGGAISPEAFWNLLCTGVL